MTLTAAGYVITNAEAIWGVGQTREEAWTDFERGMASAGIPTVDKEPDEVEMFSARPAVRSEFSCEPATQALLDQVASLGGAKSWGYDGGIACTRDEEP